MPIIRSILISVLICGISTAVYAQDVTRKQLQLIIRESISEAEFERMLHLKKTTPNDWSQIFDEVIEPEREAQEHSNRSQRRYIVPERKSNAMRGSVDGASSEGPPSQLAIDVNAAPMDAAVEEPATVEVAPNANRRQRLYRKDGRREEIDDSQAPIPATSMRRRLKAAQAAEADQTLKSERSERGARLYRSSRKKAERSEDEDEDSEDEKTKEKTFGAKVLGRDKKIIGAEEDRFGKFQNKKPIERKIFRSGSYDSNGRKIKMFGRDKDE